MASKPRSGAFDHRALALWQVCPRRFLFQEVERARPDSVPRPFAGPLEVAGQAGVGMVLMNPWATRAAVRRHMRAGFESALRLAEATGPVHDPDRLDDALATLEGERLELVLELARDERVRRIEWTGFEARFEWHDAQGRRFAGDVGQIGLVKEPIAGFGRRQGEPTDLAPGTRVVVDWRFGSDVDLSPVGLALHLPLGFDLLGLNRCHAGPVYRGFVGALRPEARGPDFHEAQVAWDVLGPTIARTVEEIEAAAASGSPDAYPARGPLSRGCFTCPFRQRCIRGA